MMSAYDLYPLLLVCSSSRILVWRWAWRFIIIIFSNINGFILVVFLSFLFAFSSLLLRPGGSTHLAFQHPQPTVLLDQGIFLELLVSRIGLDDFDGQHRVDVKLHLVRVLIELALPLNLGKLVLQLLYVLLCFPLLQLGQMSCCGLHELLIKSLLVLIGFHFELFDLVSEWMEVPSLMRGMPLVHVARADPLVVLSRDRIRPSIHFKIFIHHGLTIVDCCRLDDEAVEQAFALRLTQVATLISWRS